MGLIQYYQITSQPVNQAICIFIIMPIVFCNLVSMKIIIIIIIIVQEKIFIEVYSPISNSCNQQ